MGYSCTGVLKWKCDTIIESEVDNQIVSNELISNSTGNKEKRRVKSGREDGKKGDYFTDYYVGQDGLRFVLPTYLFLKYFVRMNWQIIGSYRAHAWGFTIGSCIAAGGIICSFWRKKFFSSSSKVSDIPGVVHVLGHFDLGHSFAICLESSPHVKVIHNPYMKNKF